MRTRILLTLLFAAQSLAAIAFSGVPEDGRRLSAIIAAPGLSGPADGVTLTNFEVGLTWLNPAGTTQVDIEVMPANDDGPGVNLHLGSAATSLAVPAPPQWYGLLPDMTYTWRVRVSDATGFAALTDPSWSPWAERRFRTPKVDSGRITPVAPSDRASDLTGSPTLQWANNRSDVFYYEVQVSPDVKFDTNPATATAPVFSALLHGGVTTPQNSYAFPGSVQLQAGTTYYWRVRPRVQGDGTPVQWTAPFSFTMRGVPATFAPEGPSRPVLAQYYAWYDTDTFGPAATADIPVVRYNSDDPTTIARHVREARSAGIDALALSWLGPSDRRTNGNLQKLLGSGAQQGLWATVTLETDKPEFSTQQQVVAGLRYLRDQYAGRPNWLRYQGRPVYLFWRPRGVARGGGESVLDAWRAIRDQVDPDRQAVWIMEGLDYNLLDVFDGQFGYSLAWSPDVYNTTSSWATRVRARGDKIFMATAMPGYDDTRVRPAPEGFARDREGGAYLAQTWDAALRANADWVNLTSFNEWIEGSQIEPSITYGNQYLDINREWSERFKGR